MRNSPTTSASTSSAVTYSNLKARVTAKLKEVNIGQQQIHNRLSTLNSWQRKLFLSDTSPVGNEFRHGYDDAVLAYIEELREEGKASRTVQDRLRHLADWKLAYDDLASQDNWPAEFGECIRTALAGRTISEVARLAGLPISTLRSWRGEGAQPRLANFAQLPSLERALLLPEGALTKRAVHVKRSAKHALSKIASETPKPNSAYRNRLTLATKTDEPYCFKPTASVESEWQSLVRFKTTPFLDDGFQRNAAWRTKDCSDVSRKVSWAGRIDGRISMSAAACWSHVSSYLGFLCLVKSRGGLAMRREVMTVGLLSDADYIVQWAQWKTQRSGGHFHAGIVTHFQNCISCLRPETGYLWQHAELAIQLPQPERIGGNDYRNLDSEERTKRWRSWCEQNRARLETVLRNAEKSSVSSKSREPTEPIADLLALDEPLTPLVDMLRTMEAVMPPPTRRHDRAVHLRDTLLLKMLINNPLRVHHFSIMRMGPQGKGNIYRTSEGEWRIFFSADDFKNTSGAACDNYDVGISPFLWPDIDRYVSEARSELKGGCESTYFFLPSRIGGRHEKTPELDGKWGANYISKRVLHLTRLYLADSPGFSPHAWRALVATAYLRQNPGDFINLANLLHDKLETVLASYAHMRVDEGLKRYHLYLESAWKRFGQRRQQKGE